MGIIVVVGIFIANSGGKVERANSEGDNNSTDDNEPILLKKPAKPKELAFIKEGLVAYYPFNGNAKNEMGEENDGEINGATLGEDRHGSMDASLIFDGVDDYLQIKKPIYGPDPMPHSISLWFRPGKTGGHILSDRHGASCNYKYRIAFRNPPAKEQHVTWEIFTELGELANHKNLTIKSTEIGKWIDEWMHLVCAYDLEVGKMTSYVNGEKISEQEHLKAWSNAPNPTTVGAFFGCAKYGSRQPEGYFKGSVDDVRFYNRALSAAEVKALYDLEKPKGK